MSTVLYSRVYGVSAATWVRHGLPQSHVNVTAGSRMSLVEESFHCPRARPHFQQCLLLARGKRPSL